MNIKSIIDFLDNFLRRNGRQSLDPVEANALLERAGLLRDRKDRPGSPLRDILRKGKLPHAFQLGGKGSSWTIPLSTKPVSGSSDYSTAKAQLVKAVVTKSKEKADAKIDIMELKMKLEKARLKYKPETVKYLLIAEAPPDSIDRFFYYNDVRLHDYLFLGVTQALYPELKNNFLESGRSSEIKESILNKLRADGFYLLDLSELPLSLLKGSLNSQLPALIDKINQVTDKNTKIILIKATVYDTAFNFLRRQGFSNVFDFRITFPGQGGQIKFQNEFKEALKFVGYL